MVKLLLAILAVSFSIGFSQREIPKGYYFKCQPKEGLGMLGVFQNWSTLMKPEDYSTMLKFDSLKKAALIFDASLSNLKSIQQSDAYKELDNYLCSKAYIDLDFYVENAIAFYQFLLQGFQATPPTPIPDYKNEEDFENLWNLLNLGERFEKMEEIRHQYGMVDKYVNESIEAFFNSKTYFDLIDHIFLELDNSLRSIKFPAFRFLHFTEYIAPTFWKMSSTSSGSTILISVPLTFFSLAVLINKTILQFLPFKMLLKCYFQLLSL